MTEFKLEDVTNTQTVEGSGLKKVLAQDKRPRLTQYSLTFADGPARGKRVLISKRSKSVVVGRLPQCDVNLDDVSVSRVHALIKYDAKDNLVVVDNESANGTYINAKRIPHNKECKLKAGDRLRFGKNFVFIVGRHDVEEDQYQAELYESAVKDSLTRIYNRKYFMENMEREHALVLREATHFSLIMFDIDHFKLVNDNYGHLVGDQVLKSIAQKIQITLRKEDIFARYGGEEFIILLKNLDLPRAEMLAQRIRKLVAGQVFETKKGPMQLTISLGLTCTLDRTFASAKDMIARADDLLYESKKNGRNRLEVEQLNPAIFQFGKRGA